MDESLMTLDDYIVIIRRRKWSLVLPALAVMVLAIIVAFVLPPVYKSTATILIEEQEIPSDFVTASVTSYAEQRIQTINQRIMSSTRLMEIINRFDLYHDLRNYQTIEEIVDQMRDDTKLEMINADVIDPRTGRPSEASIAFSLSYQCKDDPQKVEQVANVLTSLFLEENLRERARQTKETAQFIDDEMKKVKRSLDITEANIAKFKAKNINALPEMLQVNTQNLSNTERNIETLQEQLRSQKERQGYLQVQLAGIAPQQEDKQRLDQLRVQLVQLKTRFSDEYPDVIKVKTEIADLQRQMAAAKSDPNGRQPDNPAYVTLASQLASTQAEIESIKTQIQNLSLKVEQYQHQIDDTPKVEESYRKLVTERSNTQAKYDDLMRKLMEARVSQGLEKEQKGERFTLIDPPRLPEKPFKPNRVAILAIGAVLAIGTGVGLAALRESSDGSVHSVRHLTDATSFPVLAMVPVIVTTRDLTKQRLQRVLAAVVGVVAIAGGVTFFHFRVMDLSVFWAKLMRHLAI
jgi:protein tyrosine kinase modulator